MSARCFLVVWAAAVSAIAAESTGWRRDGSGQYPNAKPPTAWDSDAGEGILWQTKVGKGQSTPIVVGERVLLTAEPDRLVAVDRQNGQVQWTSDHSPGSLPPDLKAPAERPRTSPGCGYSTPSPVTDGQTVYVSFGTAVVACYDLTGARRWIRYLDVPAVTEYGHSASPVLADGKLLVSIGGLVALEARTGETCWQNLKARPTYGTPAVARIGDQPVAITPAGDVVRVADGALLARGLAKTTYTSPVVQGGVVYFADSPAVAVRLPEQAGDTIACQRLWENDDLEGEFFASPVYHDGLLYCVSNEGTFYVLDAATGKLIFQHELDIRSASGKPGSEPANLYPSVTLAGAQLLVGNDVGETLVLALGREYREAGRNFLERGSGASPVPDGDRLFVRGADTLYCLGKAKGSRRSQ